MFLTQPCTGPATNGWELWFLSYLFIMKLAASFILCLMMSALSYGQNLGRNSYVMFRNDIVLGKHTKQRNKGISFITISMGRQLGPIPYSGGTNGMLIIDLQALRNPGQTTYTYRQLAERTYGMIPGSAAPNQDVPHFLLMEPTYIAPPSIPVVRVRR